MLRLVPVIGGTERRAAAALVATGFSAAIGQIVLMRELIVVFHGNEITLGLMLATWLLWTAAGCRLGGRLGAWRSAPAGLLVLLAAAFPATIFAVRASRQAAESVPGEMLGPGAALTICFVTLSGFCFCSGLLFAAAARWSGRAYLFEAAGSAVGGLIASLVLLPYAGAFEIALWVGLVNLATAAALVLRGRAAAASVVVLLLAPVAPRAADPLEQASLERLWHGFRIVGNENSVYGNLAVIAGEGSGTIYENGVATTTIPDRAAAEESVHYALLEHPAPRSLLLIGGGVNGGVVEALRHPTLEHVEYVELDPAVFGVARRYFPAAWAAMASNPRVHLRQTDGRLFLKTTGERFDVIRVNLPDPQTAQLNRFYTVEFFREAARRLTAGGVLSFAVRGSENYISAELGGFLASIAKTAAEVFPEVKAMPGETIQFFAALRTGVLAGGAEELIERLRARRLETRYVQDWAIRSRMTADRVGDLEAHLRPSRETPVNRDFAPVAYYFDMTLWAAQFHSGYRAALRGAARAGFAGAAAVVVVAMGGVVILLRRIGDEKVRLRRTAAFSTAATGFAMMGVEILLLLGFQAVYGYVYSRLAMLTAAFMAGMAVGAWRGARSLMRVQIAAAIAAPAVCGFLALAAGLTGFASAAVSEVGFPVMAAARGAIGGAQFAAASRIYLSGRDGVGALYAFDLAGACAAALALSTYFIPVFGFARTAGVIATICAAPVLVRRAAR